MGWMMIAALWWSSHSFLLRLGLSWSSHAGLYKNPVMSVTHGIGFHPLLFRDGGS
jgi:hypothetical protein